MRSAAMAGVLSCQLLAACSTGGLFAPVPGTDQVYAPGLDTRGQAVDGLIVGHRLMDAGEYDLALEAYTRAAAEQGLTGEVMVALGSANLAMGRLQQAERLLRRAVEIEPDWPEAWNNLGVLLIETEQLSEAVGIFRKAYALDNGESDAIRDNLRLALAKLENSVYVGEADQNYKLVRRGSGLYTIRTAPR
jgi:Flp pilus assembly protein TadD